MAPSNPDVIYVQVQAILGNTHGQLGVWRTTDGGVTWEQRSGAIRPDRLFRRPG